METVEYLINKYDKWQLANMVVDEKKRVNRLKENTKMLEDVRKREAKRKKEKLANAEEMIRQRRSQ